MASTKQMQARAKAAKEAAKQAQKPQAKEYGILAIRHCEDGSPEFVHFAATYSTPKNDKNALLHRICTKDWAHTPPAGFIAEYLFQTNTFAMMQNFGGAEAFILNFYEVDAEATAKNGKKTFSCRDIMAAGKDDVQAYANNLRDELAQKSTYSVKTH